LRGCALDQHMLVRKTIKKILEQITHGHRGLCESTAASRFRKRLTRRSAHVEHFLLDERGALSLNFETGTGRDLGFFPIHIRSVVQGWSIIADDSVLVRLPV
jgi:hypothetical protein